MGGWGIGRGGGGYLSDCLVDVVWALATLTFFNIDFLSLPVVLPSTCKISAYSVAPTYNGWEVGGVGGAGCVSV